MLPSCILDTYLCTAYVNFKSSLAIRLKHKINILKTEALLGGFHAINTVIALHVGHIYKYIYI